MCKGQIRLVETMATFKVSSVEKESKPLPKIDYAKTLTRLLGRVTPESYYQPKGVPVWSIDTNVFVSAVHNAFAKHYPLTISPDHVWMCIAQGLSSHVNANAEKLKSMFVEHEGKKTLTVRRDDFVKGDPNNPWPEVFDEFSEQIRQHVGAETHDLLTPEFTTTGPNEKAAAQIVLMDTLKNYFRFSFDSECGIPEITLEGTLEDWKKLRDKTLGLARYDLDWWIKPLKPILDQFVDAASGKIDVNFWCDMYKRKNTSGGPYITGWIVTLFPYTGRKNKRNPYLESWNTEWVFGGVKTSSFPRGVVYTPFNWLYQGNETPMHFYAGFMCVTQDPHTLAIRPEIGWAVANDQQEKNPTWNDCTVAAASLISSPRSPIFSTHVSVEKKGEPRDEATASRLCCHSCCCS